MPADAVGVQLNVVAVNPITAGNVVVSPAGDPAPEGGIVNYQVLTPSLNDSNAFSVALSDTGRVDVRANCGPNCSAPTVHVRGVVLGYHTGALETRVAALESWRAQIDDIPQVRVIETTAGCPADQITADLEWVGPDVGWGLLNSGNCLPLGTEVEYLVYFDLAAAQGVYGPDFGLVVGATPIRNASDGGPVYRFPCAQDQQFWAAPTATVVASCTRSAWFTNPIGGSAVISLVPAGLDSFLPPS